MAKRYATKDPSSGKYINPVTNKVEGPARDRKGFDITKKRKVTRRLAREAGKEPSNLSPEETREFEKKAEAIIIKRRIPVKQTEPKQPTVNQPSKTVVVKDRTSQSTKDTFLTAGKIDTMLGKDTRQSIDPEAVKIIKQEQAFRAYKPEQVTKRIERYEKRVKAFEESKGQTESRQALEQERRFLTKLIDVKQKQAEEPLVVNTRPVKFDAKQVDQSITTPAYTPQKVDWGNVKQIKSITKLRLSKAMLAEQQPTQVMPATEIMKRKKEVSSVSEFYGKEFFLKPAAEVAITATVVGGIGQAVSIVNKVPAVAKLYKTSKLARAGVTAAKMSFTTAYVGSEAIQVSKGLSAIQQQEYAKGISTIGRVGARGAGVALGASVLKSTKGEPVKKLYDKIVSKRKLKSSFPVDSDYKFEIPPDAVYVNKATKFKTIKISRGKRILAEGRGFVDVGMVDIQASQPQTTVRLNGRKLTIKQPTTRVAVEDIDFITGKEIQLRLFPSKVTPPSPRQKIESLIPSRTTTQTIKALKAEKIVDIRYFYGEQKVIPKLTPANIKAKAAGKAFERYQSFKKMYPEKVLSFASKRKGQTQLFQPQKPTVADTKLLSLDKKVIDLRPLEKKLGITSDIIKPTKNKIIPSIKTSSKKVQPTQRTVLKQVTKTPSSRTQKTFVDIPKSKVKLSGVKISSQIKGDITPISKYLQPAIPRFDIKQETKVITLPEQQLSTYSKLSQPTKTSSKLLLSPVLEPTGDIIQASKTSSLLILDLGRKIKQDTLSDMSYPTPPAPISRTITTPTPLPRPSPIKTTLPTIPLVPPLDGGFGFPSLEGGPSKPIKRKKQKQKKSSTPSLRATVFKLKGKTTKISEISGLGERFIK